MGGRKSAQVALIETMLWTGGQFCLLDYHLERLRRSAQFFGVPISVGGARRKLEREVSKHIRRPLRVRLTVSAAGLMETSSAPIAPGMETWRTISLSDAPVDSSDPFLSHKTTHREHFDAELLRITARRGCDEVIFMNERGELTEGARSTLFIGLAGKVFTPPLKCGLLPGTLRQFLLDSQALPLDERVLYPSALRRADRIYVGNSVRGLMCVELI